MSNPNGARGAKAERDLVVWLREHGWPDACRARGEGTVDRGDIGGIPGVCVQVKAAAKPQYVMPRLRAAQQGAVVQAWGRREVAVVKLPGVGDPAQWWAATPVQWLPNAGTGRFGDPTPRPGYDLPIDACDVSKHSQARIIHAAIGEHGGALRDGPGVHGVWVWWITTVDQLFAALEEGS